MSGRVRKLASDKVLVLVDKTISLDRAKPRTTLTMVQDWMDLYPHLSGAEVDIICVDDDLRQIVR